MEALWKEKAAIQANQAIAITMARQTGPGFDASFHRRGIGPEPESVLDGLRTKFKQTLRPFAQLEVPTSHAAA